MANGTIWKRCTHNGTVRNTGLPARGRKPAIPVCRCRGGTWWWRIDAGTDPTTGLRRQPSRGGYATKVDALEALDTIRTQLRTGEIVADSRQTVAAWLTEWLTECEATLSARTVAGYRAHVIDILVPALGHHRIRDLRRAHLEKLWAELAAPQQPVLSRRDQILTWIAEHPDGVRTAAIRAAHGNGAESHVTDLRRAGLVTSPKRGTVLAVTPLPPMPDAPPRRAGRGGRRVTQRQPRTVDSVRRTLRAALAVAKRRGIIPTNHAEGRMDNIPRIGRASVSWWQPEELLSFLDAAGRHPWSALWTVAAYTGLRRSELCGIRWTDLDLTGPTPGVTVTQRVIVESGPRKCPICKENHTGRVIKPGTKTDSGCRWVPLTAESVLELVAHRAMQDAAKTEWGNDYHDHGLVFALDDGIPLNPNDVTHAHADLIAEAELRKIRLHDMRHTACSLLLAAGTPIEVVAMILGHASPAVTRGVYAHVLRGPASTGMEAAARLVRPTPCAHSVHSGPGNDHAGGVTESES